MNVGAVAVIAVSVPEEIDWQPFNQYIYFGPSLSIPLSGVVLIPNLTFGAAPENGNWGFTLSPVIEIPFWTSCGFDIVSSVSQDTLDNSTQLFWGIGPGLTINHETSFGIATQLTNSFDTNAGWALNVIANFGLPIP